jgi:hypothetical protein
MSKSEDVNKNVKDIENKNSRNRIHLHRPRDIEWIRATEDLLV